MVQLKRTMFPTGVNNSDIGSFGNLEGFPYLDITKHQSFFDDFVPYRVSRWRENLVNGTITAGDEQGGIALLATTGAIGNQVRMQAGAPGSFGASFHPTADKQIWFESRFSLSINAGSDRQAFTIGLMEEKPTGSPINQAGIYIQATADAATPSLFVNNGSTVASLQFDLDITANEFLKMGFHYNKAEFDIYVNDDEVAAIPAANAPSLDGFAITLSPFCFTESVISANSQNMPIDFVSAIMETDR